MDKIPATRPDRVIRALQKCGLEINRQSGSHVILSRSGLSRPVVVAQHKQELKPKTIAKILAQAGITRDVPREPVNLVRGRPRPHLRPPTSHSLN